MTCFQPLVKRKNNYTQQFFLVLGKKVSWFFIFSILFSFQTVLWILNNCISKEKLTTFIKIFFFHFEFMICQNLNKPENVGLTILFFLNSRWQYLFICSKNLNHSNNYRLRFFSPTLQSEIGLFKIAKLKTETVCMSVLLKCWLKGYRSTRVDENYALLHGRAARLAALQKAAGNKENLEVDSLR